MLLRNLELHGVTGVHAHHCALGEREGAREMTVFPNAAGIATSRPEVHDPLRRLLAGRLGPERAARVFAAPRAEAVRVRTLSSVLAEAGAAGVDLLKVDTEGDEGDVLRGVAPGDWPGVRQVAGEAHSPALLAEVEALLGARGFRVSAEAGLTGTVNRAFYAVRGA